jgi:hypothetical protein
VLTGLPEPLNLYRVVKASNPEEDLLALVVGADQFQHDARGAFEGRRYSHLRHQLSEPGATRAFGAFTAQIFHVAYLLMVGR